MKIMLICNDGAGFASDIEVPEGQTIQQLFRERMKGQSERDFILRINRLPTNAQQVLQPGDRVSITPTKLQGARCLLLDPKYL